MKSNLILLKTYSDRIVRVTMLDGAGITCFVNSDKIDFKKLFNMDNVVLNLSEVVLEKLTVSNSKFLKSRKDHFIDVSFKYADILNVIPVR